MSKTVQYHELLIRANTVLSLFATLVFCIDYYGID